MTSRDFCYWLQGYFELLGADQGAMTSAQVTAVRAHLAMVFAHEIDPSMGSKEHREELQDLHDKVDKQKQLLDEITRARASRSDLKLTC